MSVGPKDPRGPHRGAVIAMQRGARWGAVIAVRCGVVRQGGVQCVVCRPFGVQYLVGGISEVLRVYISLFAGGQGVF